MATPFQNKLFLFRVEPPPAAWEHIESRLDAEFSAADVKLAEHLADTSIAPPEVAWKNIAASIATPPAPTRGIYRRLAVAAALGGLIALASVFLLQETKHRDELVNNTRATTGAKQIPSASTNQPAPPDPAVDRDVHPSKIIATITSSGAIRQPSGRTKKSDDFASRTVMQTVAVNDRVQISAPPLRDDNGQIIMDLELICDPNLPYLFVTAPNGSPTRISDKFRACIPYLSNHPAEETVSANPCLEQFKSWRDKLLNQAAFIPSANNFFDIFELQELIEE